MGRDCDPPLASSAGRQSGPLHCPACGLWLVACGLWLVACGLRLVACGLWLVACGLWLVACGLWLVACGLWLVNYALAQELSDNGDDEWLVARDGSWGER